MAALPLRGLCGVLTVLVALASGCSTNPITGRSQFVIFTEEQAIGQSAQAYAGMMGDLRSKGRIGTDHSSKGRVDRITDSLIAQAARYRPETRNWSWEVNIVESSDVNAFCMPGGKMAVFTGLIEKIQPTDDELAQVMGHEIGHALANHGAEKMSVQFASDLAVVAIAAAASRDRYDYQAKEAALALGALAAIKLPNSREAEDEADKIGLELAARAGYDPRAAVTLWEKMIAKTGGNTRLDFLSTHPAGPKRIERMQALMPYMMAIYEDRESPPAELASPSPGPTIVAAASGAGPGAGSPNSLRASAAPAGNQSRLTFFSEDYEKFKAGRVSLDCIGACALGWGYNRSQLKKWYDAADWRPLATKVTSLGFDHDVSYFYLARAAEALGYPEPAKHYYEVATEKSKNPETACKGRFLDICDGIDVPKESEAGLSRLADRGGPIPGNLAVAAPGNSAPASADEAPQAPGALDSVAAALIPAAPVSALQAGQQGTSAAPAAQPDGGFTERTLAGTRQLATPSWGEIYVDVSSMTTLSELTREIRLATITTYKRGALVQRDTWEVNCSTGAVKWRGWTKYSRDGDKLDELTFSPPQAALGGLPSDTAANQVGKVCEW